MNRTDSIWKLAFSLATGVPLMGILALGCAHEVASESETTEESALTSTALDEVLRGGKFRCAEAGRGDVVVELFPKGGQRVDASLEGWIFVHVFDNPASHMRLYLRGGELSGTSDVYTAIPGHGYYCGAGGGGSDNCAPDHTNGVRFFVQGGALRCEVTMARDEPWGKYTSKISASPERIMPAATPAIYGSTTGTHVVPWAANGLSGFRVSLPKSLTLEKFGIIAAQSGSHAIMALYTDVGGRPDALVASTASTLLSGADQQIAPLAPTTLPAGSYWLMGEFDATTPMRTTLGTSTSWVDHTFGTTLPASIPTLGTTPDVRLNFYVVAR